MSGNTDVIVDASNGTCKRSLEDDADEPNKKVCTEEGCVAVRERLPKKKKFAVLLGYYGKNYYGMQTNAGFKTIEGELLEAMLKGGLISSHEKENLYQVKFQRAARTDRGVSAITQVVSMLLAEGCKADDINLHLPEDIRVFSMKRVTKGFDCKKNCFARTYSYTLPTYALSGNQLDKFLEEDYRVPQETIQRVNELLGHFVGSHKFHNFTSKKAADDPSACRYIMSFQCDEPFVHVKEFVTLKVKGQSFMLHQIRKMVGTVIAIIRGLIPPDFIQKCFKDERQNVPKAPSSGLLLENIHYDKYDRKYGSDGIHDDLTWSDVRHELDTFRREKVMKLMLDDELEQQSIVKWLEELEAIVKEQKAARELERSAVDGASQGASVGEDKLPVDVPEEKQTHSL